MTTNPEDVARLAHLDQMRAESEQLLDLAIDGYRSLRDESDETVAHSGLVVTAYRLVDPDEQLEGEFSGNLTKIAEAFACAVSRLAKAGNQ